MEGRVSWLGAGDTRMQAHWALSWLTRPVCVCVCDVQRRAGVCWCLCLCVYARVWLCHPVGVRRPRGHAWFVRAHGHSHHHQPGPPVARPAHPHLVHGPVSGPAPGLAAPSCRPLRPAGHQLLHAGSEWLQQRWNQWWRWPFNQWDQWSRAYSANPSSAQETPRRDAHSRGRGETKGSQGAEQAGGCQVPEPSEGAD